MQFAKLFDTEFNGQVLVKFDSDDKGLPEVRFYFSPEDLGVCSIAVQYDSEEKWDEAEKFFNTINEDTAIAIVSKARLTMDLK